MKVKQKQQASASPYVRGFQRLQGGAGDVPKLVGQPYIGGMPPPKLVGQPYVGGGGGNVAGTDPTPYGGGMPGSSGDAGGGTLGQPGSGGMPGLQSPGSAQGYYASHPNFRPNFWRNPTTGDWQRRSPGGGGFYPPGQGMRIGLASGTPEVPDTIGSPNTQVAYGPPITLTAPQIQRAAQQAGLSQGQLMGLMKAFQGGQQAYGELAGNANAPGTGTLIDSGGMAYPTTGGYQEGTSSAENPADPLWKLVGGQGDKQSGWDDYFNLLMDRAEKEHPGTPYAQYDALKSQYGIPSAWSRTRNQRGTASVGFQGGISDIGYPPTLGQGMDFHGDRGGWLGQFDPNYTFSRYARGTSMVPGW